MAEPLILEGEIVRLEPLKRSHGDDLARAAEDGELWRSALTIVPSRDTVAAYIEAALDQQAAGRQTPFVIVHKPSGSVVGTTRYKGIDLANRRREIGGTWISAGKQRTGVNTEAKFLLLRQAFEGFGCIRVEFITDVLNTQSRIALVRLHAKHEGLLRNHMVMPDGRYRDSVCYSIIESEWPAVKAHLSGLQRRYRITAHAF